MFGGKKPQGFTIVETVIFLAISGILFVSVVGLIQNKQSSTYFTQGSHEVFSQIQSLSNSVQTGYFNDANKYSCTAPLNGPISFGGVNSQGSSFGCTFIGYVLQFQPMPPPIVANNNTKYNEYAVFGRQFADGSTTDSPADFASARPVAQLIKTVTIPPRFTISSIHCISCVSTPLNSLVGFFSNFSVTTGSGAGALNTQLVPIPTTAQFVTPANAQSYIAGLFNCGSNVCSTGGTTPTVANPTSGIDICLQSTADLTKYAVITIGGSTAGGAGNPLSVQLKSYQGATCT